MPNGIFPGTLSPGTQYHSHPHPDPGLGLRLRTRWRQNRLDRELAAGTDPAASPELKLRAAQLQSRGVRSRLATAIVHVLGQAHEPKYADNLRALVARLRDDGPIDIQGAAMTARLVNDRSSPLYRAGDQDLRSAVLSARLALERSTQVRQDLARAA